MTRIIVDGISKKFRIGCSNKQSFISGAAQFFSGRERKSDFWALQDVTFQANGGENIGIIGLNGSGKSTLLRIIAGIYQPSRGKIVTRGKVIALSNLNAGMKEKLTMVENIRLGCLLYGIDGRDIEKNVKKIIAWTELEGYENTKLHQFSTGMVTRLVFSIAISSIQQLEPDIILMDEVFATSDGKFTAKGIEEMEKLGRIGSAVLFISHDLSSIRRNSHSVIWLERGKIAMWGKPDEVIERYEEFLLADRQSDPRLEGK